MPGREKHGFRVEDVFGITPLTGCRPAVLLAPQVVAGPGSELEPLAPSEALIGLLPNVLLTDPVASQAHLDMLAALVRVGALHDVPGRLGPGRRGRLRHRPGLVSPGPAGREARTSASGALLVELTRRPEARTTEPLALLDRVPTDRLVERACHHRVPGVVYRSLSELGRGRRRASPGCGPPTRWPRSAHGRCLLELRDRGRASSGSCSIRGWWSRARCSSSSATATLVPASTRTSTSWWRPADLSVGADRSSKPPAAV